ncbi:NAD(P)H nitroreductase [Celerinatantimonas diazotrophica]|uniref:Putative NAD(P)H nitroreductase n=1 Tax=Celerinatantimonas diazotrophica TaxID=412034 RepID=A0A4R1JLZ9_9GAMM|nr:NAD(P)H nitroreductase [Celerinatantimonas diazotrophica]TCK52037.1 nitroreductase [Celerinatantimonas diazotrophica]CAG9296260.1 Putative NAD(P)H nitroreductase YdjA [Celerinatantimonas diazotrophica]
MDSLELLLNRHSCAKLSDPAPAGKVLENIYLAGLKAPDHGDLRPWRFIEIQGEGLDKLTEIFVEATQATGGNVDKAKQMAYRAPMIIVAIASCTEHPKVPETEQLLSAGCAVHAMQMAALAQGFNGIWRSGGVSYDPLVKEKLGLSDKEQIVGFLYLGTPAAKPIQKKAYTISDFVTSLV